MHLHIRMSTSDGMRFQISMNRTVLFKEGEQLVGEYRRQDNRSNGKNENHKGSNGQNHTRSDSSASFAVRFDVSGSSPKRNDGKDQRTKATENHGEISDERECSRRSNFSTKDQG